MTKFLRRTGFAALLLIANSTWCGATDSAWLEVPYVRQEKAGCGSAAIAMVIQYWVRHQPGLEAAAADTDRINQALPPESSRGIPGQALKQYLENHGFAAFVFTGEIQDLRQHLDKGRPIVVCFGLKGAKAPLHYAVVVGMDRQEIILNDPARGKLYREDLERFERAWKVTRNWALLTVPRQVP